MLGMVGMACKREYGSGSEWDSKDYNRVTDGVEQSHIGMRVDVLTSCLQSRAVTPETPPFHLLIR